MISSSMDRRAALLGAAKRIVVKVGSGLLTHERFDDVDNEVVDLIAAQVAELVATGRKVALVSSGSVAIGSGQLNLPRHGLSIPQQQAAAALGQGSLTAIWADAFGRRELKTGQILLTHDDLRDRQRFLNARNTINTLLEFGAVPVINENDTVAVDEIQFGDNDTLAARVTNIMEADLLAILSDVDGLYDADPRLNSAAKKIEIVEEVDDSVLAVAGDSSSRTGLGGMASKVRAAREAAKFGAATIILPGEQANALTQTLKGEAGGTFFFPQEDRLSSKKHWIEFVLQPQGRVSVDDGAREALINRGGSLLALGVTAVQGLFVAGAAVEICGSDGHVFAKGLCNYHSHEIDRIRGEHSREIERILGYKVYDEIIHRDDMVFM